MRLNAIDYDNFAALGDDYWRAVGIAEDLIKLGESTVGANGKPLITEGEAKRVIRALDSQDNLRFAGDILAAEAIFERPQEFKRWFNSLNSKIQKEQTGANPIPGVVHGHHGISVSSAAAAGQDQDIVNHGKFIKEVGKHLPIGTNHEDMLPISSRSHLSDREFNAHSDLTREGVTDTGVWQMWEKGRQIADPKERADRWMSEIGRPQLMVSRAAYNSPLNQEMFAIAADELGITVDELLSTELDDKGVTKANRYRDELKARGFDAKGLEKLVYMDRGRSRVDNSSNKGVLDERPGAAANRAGLGLDRNIEWRMHPDGTASIGFRSSNVRRRL